MATINIQDFIDGCNLGLDIEFRYNGKAYAVICWPKDGIHVYDQHDLASEMILPTPDDVLDLFAIDGIPLRDVLPKAHQTL